MGVCLPHKSASGTVWCCTVAFRPLCQGLEPSWTVISQFIKQERAGLSWETPSSVHLALPLCHPADGLQWVFLPLTPLYEARLETDCIWKNMYLGLAHSSQSRGSNQIKICCLKRFSAPDKIVMRLDACALNCLHVTFHPSFCFFPPHVLVR